ncbi:acyl-CoA dehydrogenase family protein [Nocardia otitidiscaviarum]|uniref:acyl-CoA dehydrogenase family protein n=1 Tax=Nocardia otitidiscaviarum TaxID=1823 RepID=UPI0018935D52|nr:acyl-CoA dehydrogenase family protein [Nocardia otitidiscaviarum]MBF6177821.1 acyl-CoA dehydrogenase family protein [Nocardia otitidiscaviarum]
MIAVDDLVRAAAVDGARWDRDGLPDAMVERAARAGVLGADRPVAFGGAGCDARELGELAATLGHACTSLRSLLTVHGMVAAAVDRWGTAAQRGEWLPRLTSGELIAALAATEAGAGTELSAVATTFAPDGQDFLVTGTKLWVTFGQRADVYLVLGKVGGSPDSASGPTAPGSAPGGLCAALVDRHRPGVAVEPADSGLGLRGARLATIRFDRVRIPATQLIAPPGFGLSHVIGTALDHGRYTVAWGCVGLARACLDDAAAHAATRVQGGTALAEHQLIRAMLGRGWADVEGARALCERAADARIAGSPAALIATITAKYAAAAAAATVSERAVQVLGAAGCAPDGRVGRFYRDAKVMQIIEGAQEVAEVTMGEHVVRGAR